MAIKVTVTKNDFAKLGGRLPVLLAAVAEDVAQDVVRDAKAVSPPNLGIEGAWTVRRRGPFKRVVENREWRAVFYEDGTPFLPAEPMLRPAIERNRRGFVAKLARVFDAR